MVKKGRVITGYVSSQGDPGGGLRDWASYGIRADKSFEMEWPKWLDCWPKNCNGGHELLIKTNKKLCLYWKLVFDLFVKESPYNGSNYWNLVFKATQVNLGNVR